MSAIASTRAYAITLALLVSACGGNSGEEAREATSKAVEKTQEVAGEAASEVNDIATDAANKTREVAGDVTAKIKANTDGGWADMKANWADWSGRAQEQFDRLSIDDVIGTEGERAQMVELIQEKYELTKAKAALKLDEWQADESSNAAIEK